MAQHPLVFLCGLIGGLFAAWSLWSSVFEYRSLGELHLNGAKLLTGRANIARDSTKLFAQVLVLVVGAGRIATLDADGDSAAWVVMSLLLTVGLIVDRLRRLQVARYYETHYVHAPVKVEPND